MSRRFLTAAAALTLSACAATTPPPASASGQQASIPFIRFGSIYNFEPDSDRGLYLQNRQRQWYYASVLQPCLGLPSAIRIGVDTRFGGGQLDDTGDILVDGQRCRITSLVRSDGPPKKIKHKD